MTEEKKEAGRIRRSSGASSSARRGTSTIPRLFQHMSLAVFLAWVGLGADGLSSSAYGPEEAAQGARFAFAPRDPARR